MSASRQRTPRDAGFSGGSWCRLTRQRAVIPLRHAAAAAAPDANATISHRRRCTSTSFPSSTSGNPCHARGGSESAVGDRPAGAGRPQGGADGRCDLDLVPARRKGVRTGSLTSVRQTDELLLHPVSQRRHCLAPDLGCHRRVSLLPALVHPVAPLRLPSESLGQELLSLARALAAGLLCAAEELN
jgi:hypothetical protein